MKSVLFRFPMTRQQSIDLLDRTKATDQEYFRTIVSLSEVFRKYVNEDDLPNLEKFFNENVQNIMFLRIFIDESFEQAILYRYEDILQYFIQNGYAVTDPKYFKGLIMTSRFLRNDPPFEILTLLLEAGLNADSNCDDKFRTPLHLSCKYGLTSYIKILVEKGCDVNSVDSKKFTPLMYLEKAKKKYKDLEEVTKLLNEKGAKVY